MPFFCTARATSYFEVKIDGIYFITFDNVPAIFFSMGLNYHLAHFRTYTTPLIVLRYETHLVDVAHWFVPLSYAVWSIPCIKEEVFEGILLFLLLSGCLFFSLVYPLRVGEWVSG